MTFRQRVILRLELTFTAAVLLTGFAVDVTAHAQDAIAAPLFVITQDTVSAWDGTTFHHLIESGLILSADLSPDGRTLAVWRDPKNNYNSGDIWLVDVASLSAGRIYTIDPGFLGGAPLWNAESSGILWSEYREGTAGRAVEYVMATGQITVHDVELPLIHEEGEFTVPGIAWWHDEQFALFVHGHYRNRVLRAYDFSGEILSDTPIENIGMILGYRPWLIESIIMDETPMLALYYGEHGVWDLIDPATGTVTPVEGSVAFGPLGVDSTYLIGYGVNPDRSESSLLRYSDTQRYELLDITEGGVVISPDGLAYAYVSADGHDIGIVRDDETSIVSLPDTLTRSRRLRLVWSPMSGVLLPDLPPIAMPHKQTAVPGDCTGHSGIRPGATAHVNLNLPYDATIYLYGPPPRVEGHTLPAGFDFPVLRALCSRDDEQEPAHMFEVKFGEQSLWVDPNALSLTACADSIPTRLQSGDHTTERYVHLRSDAASVPLLSGADETAEAFGTISAGDRLRLITAHCGTDGRTWWLVEAPDAVEGFVPETLGGEYILESADN